MNKYLVVDEYSDCEKIYNLYELKELLIDEIKRDSFENIDDKDIIRNNFCIMEYLALSKKDDIEYIKEQLKGFGYYVLDINETLYHLHNLYGEYDEYTTDINKIIMIYIDEISQCVENNIVNYNSMNEKGFICTAEEQDSQYKSAISWIEKIMLTCGAYSKNTLDIDKIIKELNNEHHWCIEVYEKGNDENE